MNSKMNSKKSNKKIVSDLNKNGVGMNDDLNVGINDGDDLNCDGINDNDINDANFKKYLSNIVSSSVNKKLNALNNKLDSITILLEATLNLNNSIIDILRNQNEQISIKNDFMDISQSIDIKESNQQLLKKMKTFVPLVHDNEYSMKSSVSSQSFIIEDVHDKKEVKEKVEQDVEQKVVKQEVQQKVQQKVEQKVEQKENLHEKKEHKKEEKKSSKKTNVEYRYRDVKPENYDLLLDEKFIHDCLNETGMNGELKIFRKIYIDDIPKEYYPIRHIKKKLQYWCDGHMNNDDSSGTYIKNTILKNIEQSYLKINTYDNFTSNVEEFIKNQEHINNLSETKYKDKFLQKIISIINI